MAFTAKSPGKILLLGGYSVLEVPNISYVLAVNSFAHATLEKRNDGKIKINMPQINASVESDTNKIFSLNGDEKSRFVTNAVKLSLEYLNFKKIPFTGFDLSTKSDASFSIENGKSGLGSSAAVTVAVVKAIFGIFGVDPEKNIEDVHKISQLSHSLSQNKIGSGFDVAASCFGSITYVRYNPELLKLNNPVDSFGVTLDCEIKKIKPPHLFLAYASFPKESMSTVNAVSKVMQFKKAYKDKYFSLINQAEMANRKALVALSKNEMEDFKKFFEEGRLLTKTLGEFAGVDIESEKNTKLIEETKVNGAFLAKLPGAGGGDSIVALCVSKEQRDRVRDFWKRKGLSVLDLELVA